MMWRWWIVSKESNSHQGNFMRLLARSIDEARSIAELHWGAHWQTILPLGTVS